MGDAMQREDSTARRDGVSILVFMNQLFVGMSALYKFHWVNGCQLVKRVKARKLLQKKNVFLLNTCCSWRKFRNKMWLDIAPFI